MNAKEKLLHIVQNARGDDLERAEHDFAKYSFDQLQEQHGQSGRTRQEVLDDYQRERREWQAACDLAQEIEH